MRRKTKMQRLVFLPQGLGGWRREKITEDDIIEDYEELTASGVAMRFDRREIATALRAAAAELEQAD
jgi:uncharacterized protein (DUF433 family)